jgi:hypothetical protein
MLEMVTEFTETPEPKKTERLLKKERTKPSALHGAQPDVTDEALHFGSSQMVPGTAFGLEQGNKRPTDLSKQVAVSKRWQEADNGTSLRASGVFVFFHRYSRS